MSNSIGAMRATYLRLDRQLQKFGNAKCKHNWRRSKSQKKGIMECHHPNMSYGGMTRNTDCELRNCPRVLHGDEGN